MNVAWIGAIALFVLLEKTVPWGSRMSRLTGGFSHLGRGRPDPDDLK